MARLARSWRRRGSSVGFVPTMGALHDGHAALIRRSARENARTIVSIFVNPLQFGPKEDFTRYPRVLAQDLRVCRGLGTDAVYHPRAAGLYPEGFSTFVEVGGLSGTLCGEFRPGHFRGVATVVLKLINTVRPTRAYFGEKDFQQLAVIRRMISDLDLDCRIVGCPTVREADGLALSSRNRYLSAAQRARAPELHAALAWGAGELRGGRRAPYVLAGVRRRIRAMNDVATDYVRLVDASSLRDSPTASAGPRRLLAAIRLGATRLIDNVRVPGT